MAELRARRRRLPKWALILAGVLVVLAVAGGILLSIYAEPYLRDRSEDMLSSRFHSDVQIRDFHIRIFPMLALSGGGIELRHHGRTDVPPLIAIEQFSASTNLWNIFFGKPWHIEKVTLKGLTIKIPPKEQRGKLIDSSSKSRRKGKNVQVKIDELDSDNAELDILPGKPEKSPHQFLIHHLRMHDIGPGSGAPFEATLTNATPPGEIHVKGNFGPWQADEPRTTPLNASYTFKDADLSVFKGIGGILSSEGTFGGVLEQIEVKGETTTPDFMVSSGGHPMMLKTEFQATVDGTNGDTLLHPVVAHLLNTTFVCNGGVVKPSDPNKKGKEVILDVVAENARLEDFLRLAVKSDKPPLTGTLNLQTKFDLPPGKEDVVERLLLDGKFGIAGAQFSDKNVREKIEGLSRRGQGHPKDEDVGDSVSDFRGSFRLKDGAAYFRNLTFNVTGAAVQLSGTYGLQNEELDFHGRLKLDVKPSQATTGVKSFILKVFDPFFSKDGKTDLPIKITGKRDKPSFGLDFGHKSKNEEPKKKAKNGNG